jgi:polysaccharide export outer membrane protein
MVFVAMAAGLLVPTAGCTFLPSSGPALGSIEGGAVVKASTGSAHTGIGYAAVDISRAILPYFDKTRFLSLRGLASERGPQPEVILKPGDVVTVTIYESQAGGLFIPANGNVPGNYINLPAQAIDNQGYITVPYVGAVKVAGRPVSEVQQEIVQKLANKAIEPQVIITTTQNRSDKVSVLGDVNAPAELDLSPAGERLLDVISRAGGLNAPDTETYVTVTRHGHGATALFQTVVVDPRENIFIHPGDTIYVERERRTYLAFGASGLNGRFDFQESNLTLGEALGQAGGLLDGRADPSQVFLYRMVDRKTLLDAGIDVSQLPGDPVPVVFRANLHDPSAFFAVQQFRMQDKDILYVANAGSIELQKFLDIVNANSDTVATVAVNAASTKNAINALAH